LGDLRIRVRGVSLIVPVVGGPMLAWHNSRAKTLTP
jgi:hypothetical protein